MEDKNIQRLVLKEDDILLVKIPSSLLRDRNGVISLYAAIKKKLLPRQNKILMLPDSVDISVIGKEEVKEYISNIDLWSLWDENGEQVDENGLI